MEPDNLESVLAKLRDVEQALAAVEKNGVQYIVAYEGSQPSGRCYTYQRAVRRALSLLRSIDLKEVTERSAL